MKLISNKKYIIYLCILFNEKIYKTLLYSGGTRFLITCFYLHNN